MLNVLMMYPVFLNRKSRTLKRSFGEDWNAAMELLGEGFPLLRLLNRRISQMRMTASYMLLRVKWKILLTMRTLVQPFDDKRPRLTIAIVCSGLKESCKMQLGY